MESSQKDLEPLKSNIEPEEKKQICLNYVGKLRLSIFEQFQDGLASSVIQQQITATYDHLISTLYICAQIPKESLVSLIALGGYGRGELYPYSDLDLLFLIQKPDENLSERLMEYVVYPLWDAGLSVGHAVRTTHETLNLAAVDLTARTSLLDARLIAGDEGLFQALLAGARKEFFGPQKVSDFITLLHEEREKRHKRFGVTEYLLEPNVKNGKGGLRDLNTGYWAAKARFGVSRLNELADAGGATQRQISMLENASDFLQLLRLAMHLHAKRAQDHLIFELQEALAPKLVADVELLPGLKKRNKAVKPAVERLMHAYYRHARSVVIETDGILERCRVVQKPQEMLGKNISDREDEHFQILGTSICSAHPERFWENPAEIVRAFWVALEAGLPLSRETQDAISEAVADEPGGQLVADPLAAELFMQILVHSERPFAGSILEEMHHLGVIGGLIPEFVPCTGRIQHDLYHVYTVDMHSLYLVSLMKAWRRREQNDEHPTAVSIISHMDQLRSLFLAALLHDIGKPLGSGHALKGGRLAAGVAARLGFPLAEVAEVKFLVEQHLTMAHLSQRRDLSDPAMIGSFAKSVGTIQRLRGLYLLTVADTSMTSPGNLTSWKAMLLDELYMKTYVHLTRGGQVAEELKNHLINDRRDTLEVQLRRSWGEQGRELCNQIPDEMFLAYDAKDLLHHLSCALIWQWDKMQQI